MYIVNPFIDDDDDDDVRRQQIEKIRQLMQFPKKISKTEAKALQQTGASNSISQVEENSPPTKRCRHHFKLV
jgi:hypothetical protein